MFIIWRKNVLRYKKHTNTNRKLYLSTFQALLHLVYIITIFIYLEENDESS